MSDLNSLTFLLRKNTVCIDLASLQGPKPNERDIMSFIIDDVGIPPELLVEMSVHSILGHLLVTLENEDCFLEVLDKVKAGVLWTKFDTTIRGWTCSEYLTTVKITNWSVNFKFERLEKWLSHYGEVVSYQIGYWPMPRGSNIKLPNGTISLKMRLKEGMKLPGFLTIDSIGEVLHIFSDAAERVCFKCGKTGHIAARCFSFRKAEIKASKSWAQIALGSPGKGKAPAVETPAPSQDEELSQESDLVSVSQQPKNPLAEISSEENSQEIEEVPTPSPEMIPPTDDQYTSDSVFQGDESSMLPPGQPLEDKGRPDSRASYTEERRDSNVLELTGRSQSLEQEESQSLLQTKNVGNRDKKGKKHAISPPSPKSKSNKKQSRTNSHDFSKYIHKKK